ncbi:hypothetical protein P7K49_011971, partial [Saguinus oedipus]
MRRPSLPQATWKGSLEGPPAANVLRSTLQPNRRKWRPCLWGVDSDIYPDQAIQGVTGSCCVPLMVPLPSPCASTASR